MCKQPRHSCTGYGLCSISPQRSVSPELRIPYWQGQGSGPVWHKNDQSIACSRQWQMKHKCCLFSARAEAPRPRRPCPFSLWWTCAAGRGHRRPSTRIRSHRPELRSLTSLLPIRSSVSRRRFRFARSCFAVEPFGNITTASAPSVFVAVSPPEIDPSHRTARPCSDSVVASAARAATDAVTGTARRSCRVGTPDRRTAERRSSSVLNWKPNVLN